MRAQLKFGPGVNRWPAAVIDQWNTGLAKQIIAKRQRHRMHIVRQGKDLILLRRNGQPIGRNAIDPGIGPSARGIQLPCAGVKSINPPIARQLCVPPRFARRIERRDGPQSCRFQIVIQRQQSDLIHRRTKIKAHAIDGKFDRIRQLLRAARRHEQHRQPHVHRASLPDLCQPTSAPAS